MTIGTAPPPVSGIVSYRQIQERDPVIAPSGLESQPTELRYSARDNLDKRPSVRYGSEFGTPGSRNLDDEKRKSWLFQYF